MRILDRSVYVGPSLYAHFPVIRLELDLGELEAVAHRRNWAKPSSDGLVDGAAGTGRAWLLLPRARRLHASLREDEGTWLGHVLEHVAIELQNVAGEDVTFGKTRSTERPACTPWSTSTSSARRASRPASWRCACCDSLLPPELRTPGLLPEDWDWAVARDEFIRYAQRRALGPVDRFAGARRRGARHPLAAAQRPVAGAAGPRQVPAAHPGHGHRQAPRTSRSSSRATRKKPTRSSARSACRCRKQELVQTRGSRACARHGASASRW